MHHKTRGDAPQSARGDAGLSTRLMDAAPDAIVVIDARGRVVLVNQQVETLFGYQREDLIGQPVETLVPERLGDVHVQHRLAYVEAPAVRPMGRGQVLYARRKEMGRNSRPRSA